MKYREKVNFYLHLSNMLSTGIPLFSAIFDLMNRNFSEEFKEFLKKIYEGIKKGESLSKAIEKNKGNIFSDFEINVIKAAEISGNLPETFLNLSNYFDFLDKTRTKFINGIIYPVILLHAGIIIPSLPVLFLNGFLKFFLKISPPLLISYGIFFGIRFLLSFKKEFFDGFLINIPFFGNMFLSFIFLRFLQSFLCLYKSGVSILESLPISIKSMDNIVLEREFSKVIYKVKNGKRFYEGLKEIRYIPKGIVEIIQTGEETGKLEESLEKVISYYQNDLETKIERTSTVLPVVIYLIIAFYIGVTVISFYKSYYGQIDKEILQ